MININPKINQKEINFFETKINTDPDGDLNILKKKLIINSIKIYVIIFIIVFGYVGINGIIINIKYKSFENNLAKIQEKNIANSQIKNALIEKQKIKNFLEEFNQTKKFTTNIIKSIEDVKPKDIAIKEIVLNEEGINIKCVGADINNAIKYVSELRKNKMFLDILYTGGNFSSADNMFTFEINIKN